MRKIIVLSFLTIDGIMQAPGGPEEDPENEFKYGGWTAPYDDDVYAKVMQKIVAPADLLLGRKTFQIFANYWPDHKELWPGVMEVKKYALSRTLKNSDALVKRFTNSSIVENIEDIKKLKKSEGSDLKTWGSSELIHLLLKHDLVDEMWLMIHPVILGKGKRLFDTGSVPGTYTLVESVTTPSGVIMANYKRAGEVKTGKVG